MKDQNEARQILKHQMTTKDHYSSSEVRIKKWYILQDIRTKPAILFVKDQSGASLTPGLEMTLNDDFSSSEVNFMERFSGLLQIQPKSSSQKMIEKATWRGCWDCEYDNEGRGAPTFNKLIVEYKFSKLNGAANWVRDLKEEREKKKMDWGEWRP